MRHVYSGFPLSIHITDPMAAGWYDHDWQELPEVRLLSLHQLREGCRVFDLGAHHAVVALVLARVVGEHGHVLAVEANPRNASVAVRNKEANAVEQLEILHAAVAEKSGSASFSRNLNGQIDDGTGAWGRITVPAKSVDDLASTFGRPDVIFIDVEGYECQALRGATTTLKSHPDCFVEVHVGCGLEKLGGSVEELLSFFPSRQYQLYERQETGPFLSVTGETVDRRSRFFLVAIARNQGSTANASSWPSE